MSNEIVRIIAEQTETLFLNTDITLHTCDMNIVVCEMPVWKHVYHMLHSLDRWFVNPQVYDEPPFHEPDLNSLDIPSEKVLSREEMIAYFNTIKAKINRYLNGLTDNMLAEKPENCAYTRMALVLGQYRHCYAHIGIINGSTIQTTGKWPRVVGLDSQYSEKNKYFE